MKHIVSLYIEKEMLRIKTSVENKDSTKGISIEGTKTKGVLCCLKKKKIPKLLKSLERVGANIGISHEEIYSL